MSEDYLTVAETAIKLSVSPRTIQRYCKQGRLNYKWITGKRHKELRIIPPLPVSDLPGVKKKKILDTSDFVIKNDFENIIEELKQQLLAKDHRIDELEHEIAQLKSLSSGGELFQKAESLLHDFNKVRPVEKKLILKMAREIQAYGEYLQSIGMNPPETEDLQME